MAVGPGKYNKEATELREKLNAVGVVLIVIGGDGGMGFEVQGPIELNRDLPKILRQISNQIEESNKELGIYPKDPSIGG